MVPGLRRDDDNIETGYSLSLNRILEAIRPMMPRFAGKCRGIDVVGCESGEPDRERGG